MNGLLKDEIGVPTTFGAIYFNFMNLIGVEMISHVFTWLISCLSIIYLVYKIKNEKSKYDRYKNGGED